MADLDYRIGLDIGTNSIGWSAIELNFNEEIQRYEKVGIVDLGVRMFDKAEIPKTGAPLAAPRRLARSARRRLQRKSQRMQKIRQLLVHHEIVSQKELDSLYPLSKNSIDIWDIRLEGLDRSLNRLEWARLLIHLAKRRGFKSNRKSEKKEIETGKVLSSIQENMKYLASYRTVGEMWMKDERFSVHGKRRNTSNEYIFNVSRSDLRQEIITLFQAQRTFHSSYAPEQLQEEYLKVWEHQLSFASGHDILKKVGYCSLEPKERRIPRATFTFQYFVALDRLNNIRLGPNFEPLTREQRDLLMCEMFEGLQFVKKKKTYEITYSNLRKWLDIDESIRFKGLIYDPNEELNKIENKSFISLKSYYEIKKIALLYSQKVGQTYNDIDFDTFGYALTVYKNDKDIRSYLRNVNNLAGTVYDEALIEELLELSYNKFGHLSMKALQKVLPLMKQGKSFVESVEVLGYSTNNLHNKKRSRLLPPILDDITNPVVKRALSQSRKIVNAIIKKYGSPLSIHIELSRELSKDSIEAKGIQKAQEANYKRNKGAVEVLMENGVLNPSGYDIVRYKLWKEQEEKCAYSLRKIPASIFFSEIRRERGSAPRLDVDHILPYSQSFMDNYHNKVLVYSDENRKKGNRIPFNYLTEKENRWVEFEIYVLSNPNFSKKKRDYLLKREYTPHESDIVKERHLNDTRYATRFFKNFIEEFLLFKEAKIPMKKRVQTVNGIITAHFRSRWGLEKVRKDTFLHHALDAVVVACTDHHMVTKVTDYYKNRENTMNLIRPYFPWPWEDFREELLTRLRLQPIPQKIQEAIEHGEVLPDYRLVSRMAKRSVTGAAHKETIMMHGGEDEKTGKTIVVKRVALKDIKFDKNGDFKMFGKESDPATYAAIKGRYLQYNRDQELAFQTTLYKPSKNGQGNPIKRVKVEAEQKTFVREVNGGIAENGDLIRVDVFKNQGKYYMVPVYVFDTVSPDLPNRVVTSGKGQKQWKMLDDTYIFQFSLYSYDLVRVIVDEEDKFLYFSTIDISSNRMIFKDTNRPSIPSENRYTLNKITSLQKYEVGVLGEVVLVKNETRQPFH